MSGIDEHFNAVRRESFESYRDRFKDFYILERRNGIIEVRMHHEGGPAVWCYGIHASLHDLFQTIGSDPENEVMILTGSGDFWLSHLDMKYVEFMKDMSANNPKKYAESMYDHWFFDGSRMFEVMVNDLRIPTIAAINGPGVHSEFPLLCDLTICAEDANFNELHFAGNLPPGDGQFLVLQELIGMKRANYMAYTAQQLDAKTALELGIVNEVLPRDKLLPRAWELAERIMKQDRVTRRMTSEIIKRRWRRLIDMDFRPQFSMECFSGAVSASQGLKIKNEEMLDFTKPAMNAE